MAINNQEALSKKELIEKLQKISMLCDRVIEIQDEAENFEPEDHYPRKITVPTFPGKFAHESIRRALKDAIYHTEDNAVELMGKAYDAGFHPKKPAKPIIPEYKGADTELHRQKQGNFRIVSGLGLAFAIFFFLGIIAAPGALPLTLTAIGTGVYLGAKYLCKKEKEIETQLEAEAQAAYDKEVASLNERHAKAMKVYEDECAAYAPIRQAFLEDYSKWREIYLASLAEEEQIDKQLEADRQAVVDKIYKEKLAPAMDELEAANDLLSVSHLRVIDTIIELLKSNRADNLKEAINLYEEIEYRERQLELQREQEEQRQYEEECRRQDEERRHREEMKFREEQERQRQYEEERRRREDAIRADAAARERQLEAHRREYEEKERIRREEHKAHMNRIDQERKQQSAALHQCQACAHVGHCNMSIHNNTPNCTGFTPRR